MKKLTLFLGLVTFFTFSTTEAKQNIAEEAIGSCGEGRTEVSWYAECPDGTYSGSICVAEEDAIAAAEQIASAECP